VRRATSYAEAGAAEHLDAGVNRVVDVSGKRIAERPFDVQLPPVHGESLEARRVVVDVHGQAIAPAFKTSVVAACCIFSLILLVQTFRSFEKILVKQYPAERY
jgi:hypothetical protein